MPLLEDPQLDEIEGSHLVDPFRCHIRIQDDILVRSTLLPLLQFLNLQEGGEQLLLPRLQLHVQVL